MTFVLDTDVLSLFAKTESLDLLLRLFRVERLAITQGVFNELLIPLDYGYEFPRLIFAKSVIVSLSQAEIDTYENLRLQGQVSAADAENRLPYAGIGSGSTLQWTKWLLNLQHARM